MPSGQESSLILYLCSPPYMNGSGLKGKAPTMLELLSATYTSTGRKVKV